MNSIYPFAAFLPLSLAALPLGVAVWGSRLQPARRRQVETYVLMPLWFAFVVAWAAMTAALSHQWWRGLAIGVMFGGMILEKFVRRLREDRRVGQP